MKIQSVSLGRALTACLAVLLLMMSLTIGSRANAASLEDTLTQAGKEFLSSVINDYTRDTQNSFSKQFSTVKQTVKELTGQLEKMASPTSKVSDRPQILKKIADSQDALQQAATSFAELAKQTDQFDAQLERSVEDILATVQNQLRGKFANNREAFQDIANVVSAIANDTKQVNETDLVSLLTQFGDHIKTLNQTVETAGQAIKTFAK